MESNEKVWNAALSVEKLDVAKQPIRPGRSALTPIRLFGETVNLKNIGKIIRMVSKSSKIPEQ